MKKLLWLLCLCLLTGCGLYQLHTEAPAETALPTAAVTEAPAELTAEVNVTLPPVTATPSPTPIPTPEPTPTPTPTPEPTPTPSPTPEGLLGGDYDGFWYGEGHIENETAYISDTVSVTMEKFTSSPLTKYLVYYVVDIHVQDVEALRTESWDGAFGTRAKNGKLWTPFLRMVENVNPITAINGDYYSYNIHRGLVIRNGERYEPNPWKPWIGREILLLNRDGTMETYESDTFDADSRDLSDVWQAWEFGPSLLNEDGTATMSGSEFTWEKTDTGIKIIGNGTTIEGSLTAGGLTLSEEGMTFSFTREKPVAIVLAEPKTDAVLEDFNGTYAFAYVKAFETYMPAEKAIGMGLMAIPNIVIENGAISLGEMEQTREDDITVAMFSLITQAPAELKDGKLVSSPSTEFLSPEFSITLLQDGMISLEMLGGGEVLLSVIFAPVTEEATAE